MSRTMTSARPRPRLRTCCLAMGVLLGSSVLLAVAGWRSAGSESFTPVAGLPLVVLLVALLPLGLQIACGVSPQIAGAGWLFALAVLAFAVSVWAFASPATSTVDYVAAGVNVFAGVLALGLMHAFSVTRSLVFGRP